jgi:hypothetical protein
MPDVLKMSTRQFSYPVVELIFVVTGDGLIHGHVS